MNKSSARRGGGAKSGNRRASYSSGGDSNYVKCLWILSPEMTSLIRVGFPIRNHLVSHCYLFIKKKKKNVTRVNTSPHLPIPPPSPTPPPAEPRPYSTSTLGDGSLHALRSVTNRLQRGARLPTKKIRRR